MHIFLTTVLLITAMGIPAFATKEDENKQSKHCQEGMANFSNVVPFRPRNALKITLRENSDVRPSLAGLGFNQVLSNLLKKYEIVDTKKNGEPNSSFAAIIEFNKDQFTILISDQKNSGENLQMNVLNIDRTKSSLQEVGDGYIYSRTDSKILETIKLESDPLSQEKILVLSKRTLDNSRPMQIYRTRFKERTQTDEQLTTSNRRAAREFQKIFSKLFENFKFTVLGIGDVADQASSFEAYMKANALSIEIKSVFSGEALFSLSFDGFKFPPLLRERITLKNINETTTFKLERAEGIGQRAEYEIRIGEISGSPSKRMTILRKKIDAFSGFVGTERYNVLLTPRVENGAATIEMVKPVAVEIYRNSFEAGTKLIELLRAVTKNYVLGETRKSGEPFSNFVVSMDIQDASVWTSISPSVEGAIPDWQRYIKLTSPSEEVTLKKDGEDFVYRSKRTAREGQFYYEVSTESDLNTGKRYLTFSSGWVGDSEEAKMYRVLLEPKGESPKESAKIKSIKANMDFKRKFAKLNREFNFIPVDKSGASDESLTFISIQRPGNVHVELQGDAGRVTLFANDIYSDSSELGETVDTYFIQQKNLFIHGTHIKMFGSVQYRMIQVSDILGTTRKLMKLSVKIPSRSLRKYLDQTYTILLVPK